MGKQLTLMIGKKNLRTEDEETSKFSLAVRKTRWGAGKGRKDGIRVGE